MSASRVNKKLRKQIFEISLGCCEYCKIPYLPGDIAFHIDHIISEKQGGPTAFGNLALACPDCNAFKGPSVVKYHYLTKEITRLFNPREQAWSDHFSLEENGSINGLTEVGLATVDILRLNDSLRKDVRMVLVANQLMT